MYLKLIEKPCYTRQSPINIDTTNVRPERPAPMEWSLGYSTIPQSLSLLNTRDICEECISYKIILLEMLFSTAQD